MSETMEDKLSRIDADLTDLQNQVFTELARSSRFDVELRRRKLKVSFDVEGTEGVAQLQTGGVLKTLGGEPSPLTPGTLRIRASAEAFERVCSGEWSAMEAIRLGELEVKAKPGEAAWLLTHIGELIEAYRQI